MKTHFNNIFKRFNSTMNLKSFVFCDLETTGLPSMEYNRTKITEMCFTVVEADHLNLGIFPRVQNKLNICLNPKRLISPVASDLTGLHNDLLEHQPEFDLNMATLILQYLGMHRPPICLVAHNGNRFDYPILRTQFEKVGLNLSKDILCIDSLEAFRALLISEPLAEQKEKDLKTKDNASKEIPFEFTDGYDDILNQVLDKLQESNQIVKKAWNNNETTPKKKKVNCNEVQIRTKDASSISNKVAKHVASRSLNFGISFKLTDVFERLLKKIPEDSHKAECDVNMLVECAATLGERFTSWANENAVEFASMPTLTSRRTF